MHRRPKPAVISPNLIVLLRYFAGSAPGRLVMMAGTPTICATFHAAMLLACFLLFLVATAMLDHVSSAHLIHYGPDSLNHALRVDRRAPHSKLGHVNGPHLVRVVFRRPRLDLPHTVLVERRQAALRHGV